MAGKFDLVVIGTGTAAATVAAACRAAGWQVAIIDSRPFGGTCALRGCDPKKVLVGAADVLDSNRRMKGKGVRAEQARLDWPELMRFKRTFTDPVPKYREESFLKAGIVPFHGRAQFAGPTTVRVGEEILEARHVVIASGMKPGPLKFPGAEHAIISDQFLELEDLPGHVSFIGGGYISFEFAHISLRAGARVTILHRGKRPLVKFDPDLVDRLVAHTRELGADVVLEAQISSLQKTPQGLVVEASAGGEKRRFEADLVVHGAGRVPEIDDLNLSAAGVEWEPRGVKVNEFLQSTSNPAVYAAGDASASGGPALTPVAGYEGEIVADNLLKGNHRRPDYRAIPSVTFTLPPLAAVGLHEREARQQGLKFAVHQADTSRWYSSRRVGETCSGFKVLVEEGTGRILGAHLLGPQADELVNVFTMAMRGGMRAQDFKQVIFTYPTHGSDVEYML